MNNVHKFLIVLLAFVCAANVANTYITTLNPREPSPLAQRECLQSLEISRSVNNERWGMYEQCSRQLDEYVQGTVHLVCFDSTRALEEEIETCAEELDACETRKHDICKGCQKREAENWKHAAQRRIDAQLQCEAESLEHLLRATACEKELEKKL